MKEKIYMLNYTICFEGGIIQRAKKSIRGTTLKMLVDEFKLDLDLKNKNKQSQNLYWKTEISKCLDQGLASAKHTESETRLA